MTIPPWAVCLVFAGLAPFVVNFATSVIDTMVRSRTRRAFEAAPDHDEERQS
jgi:hypothetical protein